MTCYCGLPGGVDGKLCATCREAGDGLGPTPCTRAVGHRGEHRYGPDHHDGPRCPFDVGPEVTHAFTVRQPWGHAIAHLGKLLENRTRGPGAAHMGRLVAVHAGATKDVDGYAELAARGLYRVGDRVPVRAVVAVARIIAVGVQRDGRLSVPAAGWGAEAAVLDALAGIRWLRPDARKVWILGDVQPIEPVTWAGGALGVWRMPEALRERVEAARRRPPPRWR